MAEKLQGLGFQSTLPRRERPFSISISSPRLVFQSTLPRRERRIDRTLNCVRLCYFNPRSREGSDYFFSASSTFCVISIHAPAKGATVAAYAACDLDFLFQSTLPRRERPMSGLKFQVLLYFNPRSREGSDSNISQILKLIL